MLIRLKKMAYSLSNAKVYYIHIKPITICSYVTGGLDLAERRKVLTAMQLELKSQLTAVDQHLGDVTDVGETT